MKLAVKTEDQAIIILQDWLLNQENDGHQDAYIKTSTGQCACGDTLAMIAYYENGTKIAKVCVCDGCGDDDNFYEDTINVI
jgi:hypothetical protein